MSSRYINLGMGDMLRRAKRAAEMSKKGHHYGVDAIIFSAIAVEAFPNDFVTWSAPEVAHNKKMDARLVAAVRLLEQAEDDRVQIKLKYQIFYYALTGRPADTGSSPYQDFAFLIDLRNSLVHHKADVVENIARDSEKFESSVKRIHVGLAQRKLLNRPSDVMPADWKMLLDESPAVSVWAVQTALAMVNWIIDVTPASGVRDVYARSYMKPFEI